MADSHRIFGFTDEQLATLELSWRPGLFDGQVVMVSGAARVGQGDRLPVRPPRRETGDLRTQGRAARARRGGMRALGIECLAYPMTIRDPEQVAALFEAAWSHYGRLDVLVNNAGGQFPQAAIDFSVKGWNAVIDTNLNGTWYMMQAAARRWREAGSFGCIVNIVAVVERGLPGVAHTAAARAGVIYLSKTLAVEWAPLNIRINNVAPGVTATEGMNVYPEEARAEFGRANPMMRLGDAQDVADACCYLAGPSGKFITGEVLAIDGGFQMWGEQWTAGRPDYYKVKG